MKCRFDGCTNEATYPYNLCADCADEINYEPDDGPVEIDDIEPENE